MRTFAFLMLWCSLAFGYAQKDTNLDQFKDIASQIKVEAGSILILDQVARDSNLTTPVYLTFRCDRGKKKSKCELERIDGIKQGPH